MPAKNKKPRFTQIQQQKDTIQAKFQQESTQKFDQNKQQVQISAVEAQRYFQYLRKKITNQANDPFSLPFLNLKFQELDSWKDATEQLNLQSRVYGMRVDNCHQNSIKLLNHVIRNQQQQIQKDIGNNGNKPVLRGQQNRNEEREYTSYHLEKREKLVVNMEKERTLINGRLWKTIFKKCESVSELQLNTLSLGQDLGLKIDQRNARIQDDSKISKDDKAEGKNESFAESLHMGEDRYFGYQIQMYLNSNERLEIFERIKEEKQRLNQEIKEILEMRNIKRTKIQIFQQEEFEYVRQEEEIQIQNPEFLEFYQEFDDMRKDKSTQSAFSTFNQQIKQETFNPYCYQLHSIPIQHTQPFDSTNFIYQELSQNQQTQLYQPHQDFLFNSSIPKRFRQKKRRLRKKYNPQHLKKGIYFSYPQKLNTRGKIYNKQIIKKPKIKNQNLVPISYVFIYQKRNPFREPKKQFQINRRLELQNYRPLTQNCSSIAFRNYGESNQLNYDEQTEKRYEMITEFINQEGESQIKGNEETYDDKKEKKYKNVSMKTVKNEIKNQLNQESSLYFSNSISFLLISENQSVSNQFTENNQNHLGLKHLREKMNDCDPLDILMSILHIAYEEQIQLLPIFQPHLQNNQNNRSKFLNLQDILITHLSDNFQTDPHSFL